MLSPVKPLAFECNTFWTIQKLRFQIANANTICILAQKQQIEEEKNEHIAPHSESPFFFMKEMGKTETNDSCHDFLINYFYHVFSFRWNFSS